MSEKQEGPKVTIQRSCFECRHCISESYSCQSDSGHDVYCGAMEKKRIGDTNWTTPDWCPLLPKPDASLELRVAELETQLATIGDLAVADWDDAVVGKVDALVKEPIRYKDRLKALFIDIPNERDALKQQVAELTAKLAEKESENTELKAWYENAKRKT